MTSIQLESDVDLPGDWAQEGISLSDLHHALVDIGDEKEFLQHWMDASEEPTDQFAQLKTHLSSEFSLDSTDCALAEQEREIIQLWSDYGDSFTNTPDPENGGFGDVIFFPHSNPEPSLLDLSFTGLHTLPPKPAQRRVRFQDHESSKDDVDTNSRHHDVVKPSLEFYWPVESEADTGHSSGQNTLTLDSPTHGTNDEASSPDPFEPFQTQSSLASLSDKEEESGTKCFYCNELCLESESPSVNTTNGIHLCPSCL